MIRLNLLIALQYEIADHASDFILNIHAAQTAQQTLVMERLEITPPLDAVIYPDANTATRFMRLKAGPGVLALRYPRVWPVAAGLLAGAGHTGLGTAAHDVPFG